MYYEHRKFLLILSSLQINIATCRKYTCTVYIMHKMSTNDKDTLDLKI